MASTAGGELEPKPWGYLATFAWTFAAFVVGQIAALSALVLWRHGDVGSLRASPYDGAVVTLSVLVLNLVSVAVLMFAVGIRGASQIGYFALVWPRRRHVIMGVAGIAIIITLTDALLSLIGHTIVSTFQLSSYTTAAAEGWLPLMWFATVVVGPAGEEMMFRGFVFRGWTRPQSSAWFAILAIASLWALLHKGQYDWVEVSEIFVAGLFLGWMRWRSGSTLLTILLHALFNLEGMFETVVQIRHLG